MWYYYFIYWSALFIERVTEVRGTFAKKEILKESWTMALDLLEKSANTSQERVQITLCNDTLKKTIFYPSTEDSEVR